MDSRQPPFELADPDQIEALAHPTRQDIVDRLVAAGPLPVAALAPLVGRRPDALYYHLRILEGVGVVRRLPGDGRDLFDVVGRPLRLSYQGTDDRTAEAVSRAVGTMVRSARGHFEIALRAEGESVAGGARRTLRASRLSAWLRPEELEEMNRRIEEILELFRRRMADPPQDATFVEVVVLTAPLPKERGGTQTV